MKVTLLHLPSRNAGYPPVAHRVEITAQPEELTALKMAALELKQSTSQAVKSLGYQLEDATNAG